MAIVRRESTPVTRFGREWDPFRSMRALLNWDPFQELTPRLWRDEDQVSLAPAFDVKERNDAYEFTADLPGFREQDIDINLSGNRLTVSGKREAEEVQESDTYFCSERSYGSFSRSFTLPGDVNADDVNADLSDGVLKVRVPKAAGKEVRHIPLKASNETSKGDAAKGKP